MFNAINGARIVKNLTVGPINKIIQRIKNIIEIRRILFLRINGMEKPKSAKNNHELEEIKAGIKFCASILSRILRLL